jgi:hypothetical protein
MNRALLPTALALLTSLALAATTYRVTVNGQPSPDAAIVVNGKTYVPLSVLELLGVPVVQQGATLALGAPAAPRAAPGGANQRASLEGCIGETLFNGVWRLTVKAARPISRYNGQQPGYSLSLEWKNGTPQTIDALNTGVKAVTLVLADGSTLESDNVQALLYKKLPQGAGIPLDLPFYFAGSARPAPALAPPSKLLVEINPAGAAPSGVAYTTPTPSFRVRLDCQK